MSQKRDWKATFASYHVGGSTSNGGWGRLPCLTPHPLSGSCFVLLRGGTISSVIITYNHIHPDHLLYLLKIGDHEMLDNFRLPRALL